jgi:MoaA/NifB/PqqE/SkfB family radical SAM enzyme
VRTEKAYTNYRCNQNCTYCTVRRADDEPAFVGKPAVEQRIAALAASKVTELVITGGEPTLRRDLVEIVATAAAEGFTSIALETNATSIDTPRAAALAAAGLDLARVNLSGWSSELDAVTQDPGGFEATVAGIRALLATGVDVEISAVVVRSTQALLPALPAGLVGALGDASGVRNIVVTVPTESPAPFELLTYDAAAPTLTALERAARSAGIAVRVASDSGPPPCVFPPKLLVPHLYSLTPGGSKRDDFVQLDACGGCAITDRCPGIARSYLERFERPPMHEIGDDRTRRRLSIISSVEEQIERELVTPNLRTGADGATVNEHIIRIGFRCNQACRFCFVSTHLPSATNDVIESAIRAAAASPARITLSGGEPTLHPRLADYLRLACSLSPHPVQLQTNAVLLDDPARVRELVSAGLEDVLVSLHGATPETSDAVTGAPATFTRTLEGIDNLRRAGVHILLNFVICQRNVAELPAVVKLAAERWPDAILTVSHVAPSTDMVPQDRDLIPRYTDVFEHLADALADSKRLGVRLVGLESMCGIPLCLIPGDPGALALELEVPEGFDGGEFVKTDECAACDLDGKCFGIRRGYAELYGTDELRRIELVAPEAR